jgi:ubiquinone/menaquinone biosynthesis C-methylase UbiE
MDEGLGGDTIDEHAEQTELASWASLDKVRTSYDVVAEQYANELADPMVARPLERGLFLAFSELVQSVGPGIVGDVGCGPGHITRHLAGLGLSMVGYDISPAMIVHAKKKHPTGEFRLGSMLELPVPTSSWVGAVSIYATLHSDKDERRVAFHELKRAVKQGGYILHSFFVSAPDHPSGTTYRIEKWFGYQVDLDTYFVDIETGAAELDAAGFDVTAALVREPISMTELPARRCYMFGKRR